MIRFILALAMTVFSAAAVFAQAPIRLASGYSATSGPHAVLWVGREAGLFEKQGLRVEVAFIRSGTTMSQALLAGELAIAQTGGPAAIQAAVGGADFVLLAVALNTTPIVVMGTVPRIEDLKGKAIGVTRYGANTDISARYALRKYNLQPDKDVAIVQLEDYAGIMGGIASGRIAAGALADPFTMHAAKLGYKELANVAALGLEFPFVTLTAKKSYVRDHADIVQRFMRAYVEAIAMYKNKPDFAAKVTEKYTGIKDPAILSATVSFYAPKLAASPYPTVGGIRFILDQLSPQNPKAKTVAPETLMDTHFVKQLDDSGYIKALYSSR
ncbi:MAG TPA: ABC transporter substrate-binding protein [Verrucomicrobiae bacterium]|jgi:NitT/TauT family transport system substrate-binding protein|nr:ABC transporter substrate-binding protein [Verrucomicrobiae bacterium]